MFGRKSVGMGMVCLLGLFVSCLWTSELRGASVPGVDDTTIKVGYIGDMTGPIVSTSGPYRRGISTYFEYLNKEKGGVHGRKIQFITEDDKYQVALALTAFRKLVDRDNVFALVGISGSSQTAALNEDIKKLELPLVGPQQAMEFEIENPYIFVTIPSYKDIAYLAVDYALQQLAKKKDEPRIAALTLQVESGYEWAKYVQAALAEKGQKMAGHILVKPGAVEAAAQINELKQKNVNYIILHGSPANSILYLKEANRYGLKVPVVSMWGAFGPPVFRAVGEEASGDFHGLWSFSHPAMPIAGMETVREAVKKYGDPNDLDTFQVIHGWTSAKLFAMGLERAGKNLTRKGFINAMATIQDYANDGLSAPVTFGPNNTYGIRGNKLYGFDFKEDRVIPLTEWIVHE